MEFKKTDSGFGFDTSKNLRKDFEFPHAPPFVSVAVDNSGAQYLWRRCLCSMRRPWQLGFRLRSDLDLGLKGRGKQEFTNLRVSRGQSWLEISSLENNSNEWSKAITSPGFKQWKLEALGFNGGSLKWCSDDACKDIFEFLESQGFQYVILGLCL
ncbi:TMV resistance protein N-like [Pyrus ussuriensis x Pyrus communis]|uniref:TMV resistance protein N-like n=1 Tax=Pyrus ussuriensis x Pyrus communis TaxID=2448454 RepID=A0A5N5FUA1_9ROSA|nr:TMV resistance protein N-like [Pyrus ussuriensis x Pyrus communis]